VDREVAGLGGTITSPARSALKVSSPLGEAVDQHVVEAIGQLVGRGVRAALRVSEALGRGAAAPAPSAMLEGASASWA
jgi:hypothetical protein